MFKKQKKMFVLMLVYVAVAFSPQSIAQQLTESSSKQKSDFCGTTRDMKYFNVNQSLAPITTPVELLQLLKKFHDCFALLDANFVNDNVLLQLYPQGLLNQASPDDTGDKAIRKSILFNKETQLAGEVKFRVMPQGRLWGSLQYGLNSANTLFSAELIEKFLVPSSSGSDPFGPGVVPSTNETLYAMGKRPRATHPKGYFEYSHTNETSYCRSRISVRLNKNGVASYIDLMQQEK